MMKASKNAMRLQAQRAMAGIAHTRAGIVTGYNPNTYAVKVTLQPQGIQTSWIPLAASWVGNNWGMFAAPSIGDMVTVSFFDGGLESGYAELRLFNNEERPLPVPSGEFWLVHKSGAFFKLTNDGKGSFSDGHGATVTLNGDGTITSEASIWNHTGDVNVDGNIHSTKTVTGDQDVVGDGTSLHTHKHGGVQSGGSQTGAPV
jgi:phage baseplate assembly protein V